MNYFNINNLLNINKNKKRIIGECGVTPKRGERVYIFKGKSYNVEKELLDIYLDRLNKNKNIKLISVKFGRKQRISKYVTAGSPHIIFYYYGNKKSIKSILKKIPGTSEIDEDLYDKEGKLYWVYGKLGNKNWWNEASKIIGNLT